MTTRNIIIFCFLALVGCNDTEQNRSQSQESQEINIRLTRDPQYVNPFFSPSAIGREVYQYVYLPLADYHPSSLKLHPILITDIPTGKLSKHNNEEVIAYDINFRPEAEWSDGTAITAQDYAYSINAINHTQSKISAWKPYFQFLKGIRLYEDAPKKLTVYFDKDYMLSKEVSLTIQLMPAHIFDPTGILTSKSLEQIKSKDYVSQDSLEIKALEYLNNSAQNKIKPVQNGPYHLSAAEMNQYIVLDRKENYWGSKFTKNPFLQSKVEKINFKIVPDEITAITMAKEEKIDLMVMNSSNKFLELKEDSILADNWNFQVPQLLIYYYLSMNNKSEILSDKKVRRALAHLADIEDYIETLEGGLATRTAGHFHPSRSYYNDELSPLPFDVDLAKRLLSEAGYDDRDGDGIRESMVDGKVRKLELDILLTGSPLSKNMALLYQEVADNAIPGGSNIVGYNNKTVDEKIDQLRVSKDPAEMDKLYKEIQVLMYEDTPCIFLYCPLNKILISKKFKALTTTKRPGYLANTFEPT